jgi:hypothetical protein
VKGAKVGYVIVYHVEGDQGAWAIWDDGNGIMTKNQALNGLQHCRAREINYQKTAHAPKAMTHHALAKITLAPGLEEYAAQISRVDEAFAARVEAIEAAFEKARQEVLELCREQ